MLEMRAPSMLRAASQMGTTIMAASSTGPSSVAMTNHFERTRSRYSRLATA
jgi:hypothetical protein